MELPLIKATRKSGSEKITYNGQPQKASLLDFWQWSASDLISNATRGVLAEFIVAMALNKHKDVRNEWDAYDLTTSKGVKVEVKSSAYIQSWTQSKYSHINFSVRPTRAWSSETNRQENISKRQADVYVFCLLKNQDQITLDPLNLEQWTFFVVSARQIDEQLPTAKGLSLKKLQSLSPVECSYKRLNRYIHEVFEKSSLVG